MTPVLGTGADQPRAAVAACIGAMSRAGLTTDRLVRAGVELADAVGFEHVSLSAPARQFGVKDASLYSHVSGLRELRVRMALRAGGEMTDRIAAAVAGRAGQEALAAFAGAYRAYALEHPGRYAATAVPLTGRDDASPARR